MLRYVWGTGSCFVSASMPNRGSAIAAHRRRPPSLNLASTKCLFGHQHTLTPTRPPRPPMIIHTRDVFPSTAPRGCRELSQLARRRQQTRRREVAASGMRTSWGSRIAARALGLLVSTATSSHAFAFARSAAPAAAAGRLAIRLQPAAGAGGWRYTPPLLTPLAAQSAAAPRANQLFLSCDRSTRACGVHTTAGVSGAEAVAAAAAAGRAQPRGGRGRSGAGASMMAAPAVEEVRGSLATPPPFPLSRISRPFLLALLPLLSAYLSPPSWPFSLSNLSRQIPSSLALTHFQPSCVSLLSLPPSLARSLLFSLPLLHIKRCVCFRSL